MNEAETPINWLRHTSGWPFVNKKPTKLGVAVSGGGDSMALLDLMHWHGLRSGFDVEAVTVNHGLRPEATDEAAFVAEFCAQRKIPHETLHWQENDGPGNLQARARVARYALMSDWARRCGVDWIALGHTEDDQAENFLLRLARNSGVDGLATMESKFEANGLTWIRPILSTSRDQLRIYLEGQGVRHCEDASNKDPRFDRVRARSILRELEPLGIDTDTLAGVSHHMATAKWALNHYSHEEAKALTVQDQGDLILTRSPFPPIPGEIERRLLIAAIRWVSGIAYPPRQSALDEMEAALLDAGTFTLSGCMLTLEHTDGIPDQKLRVSREWNAVKAVVTRSDEIWDGRWQLAGPHAPELEIRALGEDGLTECPDWRDFARPRRSLLASPAVWRGDTLVSAPIAGYVNGWTAELSPDRADFLASLIRR